MQDTDEQKKWLSEHPAFKRWFPHSLVTIKGWTDVGYVTPQGQLVKGELAYLPYMGGAFSLGDTIYARNVHLVKVGREYDMV
jgi:hypothetical protein